MTPFGSCALCGKELFEHDQRSVQVVGWASLQRGRAKSAQALKLRRETGAVAHSTCVNDAAVKAKRGVPQKQVGLF